MCDGRPGEKAVNMIYRALKQRRTAESLAEFVQQYCQDHYQQVCAAISNSELAARKSFVGRSQAAAGPDVAMATPLYSFYVAVTAGQALELFDTWAEGKRAAAPVDVEEISRLAAEILMATLHLRNAEADAVVEGVLAEIEALDATAQSAKGATDVEFARNIAAMERDMARIVLVYCAAEKTADQLFDAWQADPATPPSIDIETATEYANLLGVKAEQDADPAPQAEPTPQPIAAAPPPPVEEVAPVQAAPAEASAVDAAPVLATPAPTPTQPTGPESPDPAPQPQPAPQKPAAPVQTGSAGGWPNLDLAG